MSDVRRGGSLSEFGFQPRHFDFLRELAQRKAGIALADSKQELVYGRVVRRIRALGLVDFDAYCELLTRDPRQELGNFINAITTNLTSFFREEHHFEFLRGTLVPHWQATRGATPRIRIWSAGCSTGEEPYSVAMALLEALPAGRTGNCRILATDIDTEVLARAASGVYEVERVAAAQQGRLRRWCQPAGEGATGLQLLPEVRRLVEFRQLNLIEPWPVLEPVDLIFCRNVVIYFDKATQQRLFDRFAQALAPDGHLIVGHAETLHGLSSRFELVGRTIYRKLANGAAR